MDSLLANYASSDEEEEPHQFSTNPKPKFNSLPPPKPSTSLFSSLPKPKPPISQIPIKPSSSSSQIPKRVVQFKPPPIFANPTTHLDDDDDEEDQQRRRRKAQATSLAAQPQSVTSFLSAIPAPRNSGASSGLGSGVGSGRRAIVDTKVAESNEGLLGHNEDVPSYNDSVSNNVVSYDDSVSNNTVSYEGYGGYETNESYRSGVENSVESGYQLQASVSGVDASGYSGYSGYGDCHGNGWAGGSQATAMIGMSGDGGVRASGKRRRNDVPMEIIEVKQDELMKNRPREDQAKSTGIAFGPSYQPVSAKGKPTKLHKRKHQIGSLYFDMKQKEMELQERRSKGFLTKAETQAKYGW